MTEEGEKDMVIDIISYTREQFALLTAEQLLEIQEAQMKKNALDRKLEADMLEEKHRLINRGMFLSGIWEKYCEKLRAVHAQEIELLREALLFYLQFAAKPDEGDVETAPYTVDYSLEMADRYFIVRDYYLSAYTEASARMEAFKKDQVARQYLGELYATLYDYLLEEE
jgi:hypothetical protein